MAFANSDVPKIGTFSILCYDQTVFPIRTEFYEESHYQDHPCNSDDVVFLDPIFKPELPKDFEQQIRFPASSQSSHNLNKTVRSR